MSLVSQTLFLLRKRPAVFHRGERQPEHAFAALIVDSPVTHHTIRLASSYGITDQERLQAQLSKLDLLSEEFLCTACHESRLPQVLCEGQFIGAWSKAAHIFAHSLTIDQAGLHSIRFDDTDVFDYLNDLTSCNESAYIAVYARAAFTDVTDGGADYTFTDQEDTLKALRAIVLIEDYH